MPTVSSFHELIELARLKKESILRTNMERFIHVIEFKNGYFKYRLATNAPNGLQTSIALFLQEQTFKKWEISLSSDPSLGDLTIKQQEQKILADQLEDISKDPKIKNILDGLSNSRFIGIISEEDLQKELVESEK